MVFAGVVGVAASADYFHGFECLAVQDHKMGRPIAAYNGQLVSKIALIPCVLTDLNRTGIIAQLNFRHFIRGLHPEVDHGEFSIRPIT